MQKDNCIKTWWAGIAHKCVIATSVQYREGYDGAKEGKGQGTAGMESQTRKSWIFKKDID